MISYVGAKSTSLIDVSCCVSAFQRTGERSGDVAPSVIDDATSSDSLQSKRAQLYQVLLVFSSALVGCANQLVRDVEDLEKLDTSGDR